MIHLGSTQLPLWCICTSVDWRTYTLISYISIWTHKNVILSIAVDSDCISTNPGYVIAMAKISLYVKKRIISLHDQSFRPCDISRVLEEEDGIKVCHTSIRRIIEKWKKHGTIERRHGGGHPSKVLKNF